MKALVKAVTRACINNCLRTGEFLPYDQFDKFVARENVADVINSINDAQPHERESLIEFVMKDGKKLFLILLLVARDPQSLYPLLRGLQSQGITDKLLPIEICRDETTNLYIGTTTRDDVEARFDFFDEWDMHDRDLFEKYQWIFLAPVFDGTTFHFHFHPKTTLPYLHKKEIRSETTLGQKVADEKQPVSSGFFGEVSRYEIHKAHVPHLAAVSSRFLERAMNIPNENEGSSDRQSVHCGQEGQA